MNSRRHTSVIAAALVAGAVSFLLAAFSSDFSFGSQDELLDLVENSSAARSGADASFAAEAKKLAAQMCAECRKLAAAFSDEKASDEQILSQLNAVLARHDALERRIARHVLAVRSELTPQQQQRLMGVFARGVRRGMRCRGSGGSCSGLQCRGKGCGRGKAADDSEYLSVLCHRLKLTVDDVPAEAIAEAPLGRELQEAAVRLDDERRVLAALLEDVAAEPDVLKQVDVVIDAHDSLERLAAARILALRQQLSPQNSKRLMSLCARQVGSVSCPWRPDSTAETCPLRDAGK